MKKLSAICILLTCIFFTSAFKLMTAKDYLSVPGPILFEGEKYVLKWSSFDKNYFKQEYLRSSDSLKQVNKMVAVEVLLGNLTIEELMGVKVKEIEKRKGKDPVANYQVLDNKKTGESLLDFLISEGDLYEWNAYRYKVINTNKGRAVLLFSYTFRSFEEANLKLDDFFPYLKENRMNLIGKVAKFQVPSITIKE